MPQRRLHYFESRLQREALSRLVEHLSAPGYLVIGAEERLPQDIDNLVPISGVPEILKYTPEADLS